MNLRIIISLFALLILESCGLLGIHTKVHNPKRDGKLPKFDRETVLLGELTKYRSCYDVSYYDLVVRFDPEHKRISGVVEIHAIALTDFDTMQLDLHPNLSINSLQEASNQKNFRRDERAVFVAIKKKKGDHFIIKVDYGGSPIIAKKPPWKGGMVWKKDKNGNHWDGVACEEAGASIWWPLKDHTSDEPDSMRLHYTVPKGLMAVGNGQLESRVDGKNTSTFNWFISYPINTYNVSFYIGKFALLADQYVGVNGDTLELNHYVLEPNYTLAKTHFQQLPGQIRLYEKRFGEYPWYRDGFKLVESPYAGMEHQTAIAYGSKYKNTQHGTDYIILHETAHEWWGNSVTATDMSDVWLQEGFATYAEALYFEDAISRDAYLGHLYFYRLFIKNKYPVVSVSGRRWFHAKKRMDVYMKGAWTLHVLRIQMENDSLFFDIIKTFATRYKYKITDTQSFIDLVNEKTGKNYKWLFDQYLYRREAPVFEYSTDNKGKFYYRWNSDATNSSFDKLKIKIRSAGQIITITPSTQVQSIQLPKSSTGQWNYAISKGSLLVYKANKRLPVIE